MTKESFPWTFEIMHVCVYMHIYTHIHMYTHTHLHIQKHTLMFTFTVCPFIEMFAFTCVSVCKYWCAYVFVRLIYTYCYIVVHVTYRLVGQQVNVYIYMCPYASKCVLIGICVCVSCCSCWLVGWSTGSQVCFRYFCACACVSLFLSLSIYLYTCIFVWIINTAHPESSHAPSDDSSHSW